VLGSGWGRALSPFAHDAALSVRHSSAYAVSLRSIRLSSAICMRDPPVQHGGPTDSLTERMSAELDLTRFQALSFDCYGTLIDWEAGIAAVLAPWAREHGLDLGDEDLLLAYADNEAAVERESPSALYPDVLAAAFRRTGERLGVPVSDAWARRLGDSVPDWPAFPDSADALARLARHYRLIVVSNVHRAGFDASNQRLRGDFAAVITAEDVGAYKPAENHFRALDAALAGLGVDRGALLHVAQSLFHDHVPARREGLRSVWINRRHARAGWGATPQPAGDYAYDLELPSMRDFADAVDRAFA
jgi:putative hydrolase of the HAD superfamily